MSRKDIFRETESRRLEAEAGVGITYIGPKETSWGEMELF